MNLSEVVARARLIHHANCCDMNNVLNQLGVLSDDKAEKKNKEHVMTIIGDILPRLGKDTSMFKED